MNRPRLNAEMEIRDMLRSLDIDEEKIKPIVNALDRVVDLTIQASFNISAQRVRFHYWNGFCQGVCVAVFVASLGVLLR